ncbi:dihydrolipoyllysine-residue acetyltransferase [Natronospirillum operosum]|uniref:Dihydrolipoamide acetyltransferase component of pyruvate dehydrogenase complex n=1 Tax=Natronospirillum operosum TaxID=2759953 RepID=A0A4Z0W2G6_9GAMM|nr:2-oxo acid dehydrogenase subunit E2 [Natronospirillum operosum]TGG91144.1 dihydrolipoyllysine-residue acetyltransferase [Natronospirillum operosum]
MKTDFILPDIGEGIVECELVEWRVQEGDPIAEDQPVADVMTDKALVEITAMHTGTVSRLYCKQGDIARVGEPLFEIEVAGDEKAESKVESRKSKVEESQSTEDSRQKTVKSGESKVESRMLKVESKAGSGSLSTVDGQLSTNSKVLATPAVRRIARENDLDLSQVPGSGRNGRVLKEDILQYLDQGGAAPQAAPATATVPSAADRTEPIKGVRAAMAKQMADSVSTIPHFTYAEEVDVTALDQLRQQLKPRFAEKDLKLSMMPFIIKALELAIRDFPLLNSRVNADCTELTYLADINVGMAADTPMGLLVPNIKRVQTLSLEEITAEVNRLTALARDGRLSQDDMKGGTISISNIGALGGTVATPIINKPEVAIVALGRVQRLPRFADDGSVTERRIMQVSWSGDHRVIDGGTMARFCNCWKGYLEDPVTMLTALR